MNASSSISGSLLEANLRSLLGSLGYSSIATCEAIDEIAVNGTATGARSIEPEDQPAVNALIAKHTSHLEYDSPSEWPTIFDEDIWTVSEELAPVPAVEPFEPSPEDRAWLAMNDNSSALVVSELMPICGGSPEDQSAETLENAVIATFGGGASPDGLALVMRLNRLTSRLIDDYGLDARTTGGRMTDEDVARCGAVG